MAEANLHDAGKWSCDPQIPQILIIFNIFNKDLHGIPQSAGTKNSPIELKDWLFADNQP